MAPSAAHKLRTPQDLLGLDPDGAFELLGGDIVEKAGPSGAHGDAQAGLSAAVRPAFHRPSGGPGGPGGWWILTEVDILLGPHDLIRPDLAGWRRDRVPERPTGMPIDSRPDWVCEVLSPSTAARDLGEKRLLLHQHEVPWYWTVDTTAQFVQVLRWTPEGYLVHATAGPGAPAALPPFEAVPIAIGLLFGIEAAE